MKIARCLIVFSLLIAVFACNDGQKPVNPLHSKVYPGDQVTDVSRIAAHNVTFQKGENKMHYHLEETDIQGDKLYKLNIKFEGGPEDIIDNLYVYRETLGFAGRELVLQDYRIDVRYKSKHFSGDLTPTPGSDYTAIKYDKHHPHDAFEPAIINYAIAVLPLRQGYKASIPVMDLNNGSQIFWSNIEVVERDKLKVGNQTYDVWKVESKGIKNKTLWLEVNSHKTIKMVTEGVYGSWERVSG